MCVISCVSKEIEEINALDKERVAVSNTLPFLQAGTTNSYSGSSAVIFCSLKCREQIFHCIFQPDKGTTMTCFSQRKIKRISRQTAPWSLTNRKMPVKFKTSFGKASIHNEHWEKGLGCKLDQNGPKKQSLVMQGRVIHLFKNLKLHFLGALCCPNPLTLIKQECYVSKDNTDVNKQKYY